MGCRDCTDVLVLLVPTRFLQASLGTYAYRFASTQVERWYHLMRVLLKLAWHACRLVVCTHMHQIGTHLNQYRIAFFVSIRERSASDRLWIAWYLGSLRMLESH